MNILFDPREVMGFNKIFSRLNNVYDEPGTPDTHRTPCPGQRPSLYQKVRIPDSHRLMTLALNIPYRMQAESIPCNDNRHPRWVTRIPDAVKATRGVSREPNTLRNSEAVQGLRSDLHYLLDPEKQLEKDGIYAWELLACCRGDSGVWGSDYEVDRIYRYFREDADDYPPRYRDYTSHRRQKPRTSKSSRFNPNVVVKNVIPVGIPSPRMYFTNGTIADGVQFLYRNELENEPIQQYHSSYRGVMSPLYDLAHFSMKSQFKQVPDYRSTFPGLLEGNTQITLPFMPLEVIWMLFEHTITYRDFLRVTPGAYVLNKMRSDKGKVLPTPSEGYYGDLLQKYISMGLFETNPLIRNPCAIIYALIQKGQGFEPRDINCNWSKIPKEMQELKPIEDLPSIRPSWDTRICSPLQQVQLAAHAAGFYKIHPELHPERILKIEDTYTKIMEKML